MSMFDHVMVTTTAVSAGRDEQIEEVQSDVLTEDEDDNRRRERFQLPPEMMETEWRKFTNSKALSIQTWIKQSLI